jgi:hypothetical protein
MLNGRRRRFQCPRQSVTSTRKKHRGGLTEDVKQSCTVKRMWSVAPPNPSAYRSQQSSDSSGKSFSRMATTLYVRKPLHKIIKERSSVGRMADLGRHNKGKPPAGPQESCCPHKEWSPRRCEASKVGARVAPLKC